MLKQRLLRLGEKKHKSLNMWPPGDVTKYPEVIGWCFMVKVHELLWIQELSVMYMC